MIRKRYASILFGALSITAFAQNPSNYDKALYGFNNPQDSTRTKVWWFHGETETTPEGITADLEAYKSAGVGGVVYYDQVHGPCIGADDALSPHWWEMFVFAAQEAKRVGLDFDLHISNGFVSGGPWITPELSMQRLSSVQTVVRGGQKLDIDLPGFNGYFKDVSVMAFRDDEPIPFKASPASLAACLEQNGTYMQIPPHEKGGSVDIVLEFDRPFTARSFTYDLRNRGKATTSSTQVPVLEPIENFEGTGYRILPYIGELECSDDGVHYRTIRTLPPIYAAHSNWGQRTVAFPSVTAKYFRIHLHDWCEEKDSRPELGIRNVHLNPYASIDSWEEKAALYSEFIETDATPAYVSREVLAMDDILDITPFMDGDGRLRWDAPKGTWRIVRFASTPTGMGINHNRSNLPGPEADRMNPEAVRVQAENYILRMADTLAAYQCKVDGICIDSHEAGSQNWSPEFERYFRENCGYDLRPWLPVMAGFVVKSPEASAKVLYDVRRTVADMVAKNFYGTWQEICDEHGWPLTAQATGNAFCLVSDQIQAKGVVDRPQGEFWGGHRNGNYDIKESSSAAHLYGKSIASAEAFTDVHYDNSPAYIKALGDYAYAFGINEFVICASSYQPRLDVIPYNVGGGHQYCLNRNNTYWPLSNAFWDWQARCSFLMRQGDAVTDIGIYLGDNAPVRILTHRLPEIPDGYYWDAFTTDALINRMSVKDGRIVLPDGHSYAALVMSKRCDISDEAMQKFRRMQSQGARIYGLGKEAEPLSDFLLEGGTEPDLRFRNEEKRHFYFAHRRLADMELYFLDNHEDTPLDAVFSFRATGNPEWWDAVSGRRYRLTPVSSSAGRTDIRIHLDARESGFVVFSDRPGSSLPDKEKGRGKLLVSLDSDFKVNFDKVGEFVFPTLTDWTENENPDIKYFSGTAVYTKDFTLRSKPRGRVYLKLDVKDIVSRIRINGQDAGYIWCAPYELDVTDFLKAGGNVLEITVANSLVNRMVGDCFLPEDQRHTYSLVPIVKTTTALKPSGISSAVEFYQY